MRRDRSYYLIQVYLPSGLIVILSWIGFWISYDAVPARLSLSVITVLTISTQTGDVRTQLPPVSYIKALDVWMSMCLIMVFASLIQFAIVNVTYRQTVKLRHRQVWFGEKTEKYWICSFIAFIMNYFCYATVY